MLLCIIICSTLVVFLGICIYVTINVYKKLIKYETLIDRFLEVNTDILNKIKEIDSAGHFEADDEVGYDYITIKEQIERLEEFEKY